VCDGIVVLLLHVKGQGGHQLRHAHHRQHVGHGFDAGQLVALHEVQQAGLQLGEQLGLERRQEAQPAVVGHQARQLRQVWVVDGAQRPDVVRLQKKAHVQRAVHGEVGEPSAEVPEVQRSGGPELPALRHFRSKVEAAQLGHV
jgi:hypothetical protein